jgi:WD40 repeat protein
LGSISKEGCSAGKLVSASHAQAVVGVEISPDNKLVASASNDGLTKLWRLDNSALIATLPGLQSAVNAVEFSPDGQMMITVGDDGQALLWQIAHITNPDYYFKWAKSWSKEFCNNSPSRCT